MDGWMDSESFLLLTKHYPHLFKDTFRIYHQLLRYTVSVVHLLQAEVRGGGESSSWSISSKKVKEEEEMD